jgi:hypothetical protein
MFRTSGSTRLLSNAVSSAGYRHTLFVQLDLAEYHTNHNLGGFSTSAF